MRNDQIAFWILAGGAAIVLAVWVMEGGGRSLWAPSEPETTDGAKKQTEKKEDVTFRMTNLGPVTRDDEGFRFQVGQAGNNRGASGSSHAPSPVAAPKPDLEARAAEREARAQRAVDEIKSGLIRKERTQKAITALKKLITTYPGTEAAQEAGELLNELER